MNHSKETEDLPKIMAAIMATVPSIVLRTGWAYLMMKKRAQKASKALENELISDGIPAKYAARLADQFANDLSVTKMMRTGEIPFGGTRRECSLEK